MAAVNVSDLERGTPALLARRMERFMDIAPMTVDVPLFSASFFEPPREGTMERIAIAGISTRLWTESASHRSPGRAEHPQ